jgi:two-component system, sporulation sensor kinase E
MALANAPGRIPSEADGNPTHLRHSDELPATFSAEQMHVALEAAETGLWFYYPETDVLYYSAQMKRLFDQPADATIFEYRTFVDLLHPDDRDAVDRENREAMAELREYNMEYRILWKDGSLHWISARGRAFFDHDQNCVVYIGTAQEISERKRFEIALQESDQRTRLGVKVASLALAEIDYITGLNHLTAEAARMFGLGDCAMSVPRDAVFATFHPLDREQLERNIAGCLDPRGTGAFDMDHRIVWPSGEVRWLRVREQIYFQGEGDARHPYRAILAAFDITDSRNIQAALLRSEKLASVGRMAATIAHEINNPLETIGQSIYLAMTDPGITEEGKHYLELATHELERAALITRQTLAFSRNSSSVARVELRHKVENVLKLFAPRFRGRAIDLQIRYRPAPPILAFAGELRQVLANLLSNSLDATPSGGAVYIRVAGYTAPDATRRVRLVVADTGSGISPEHITSIFEAFFTTKEVVGTGLGLWVTRQILDKHGALVRVRSKPCRGTVFSISFPAIN